MNHKGTKMVRMGKIDMDTKRRILETFRLDFSRYLNCEVVIFLKLGLTGRTMAVHVRYKSRYIS